MIKTKIPAKKAVALYVYQSSSHIKFNTNDSNKGDPTTTCTTAMTTTHIITK